MVVLIIIVILAFFCAFIMNWWYLDTRQEIEERKAQEELKIKREQLKQTKAQEQKPKAIPYQMGGKTHYAQPGDPIYKSLINAMREEN